MGSERRLERKLRRKEEKKGLVDGTEISSKVEVAPGELEDSTAPLMKLLLHPVTRRRELATRAKHSV